ncbi:MAG: lysophospholipid acyltransferase family protein [Spirochaetia bacterium]
MNFIVRKGYDIFRWYIRTNLHLSYDFRVWGAENIPEQPNIYCSNHFSSADPYFAMTLMKEPVHMIIGSAWSLPVASIFLKISQQINAYGEKRKTAVRDAVQWLEQGESVYVFPEGELGDQLGLQHFYAGMARIYLQNPVPIIPIGLVAPRRYVKTKDVEYGNVFFHRLFVASKYYYANIGEPMRFPEIEKWEDKRAAEKEITRLVKERVSFLIDDIKESKFWQ